VLSTAMRSGRGVVAVALLVAALGATACKKKAPPAGSGAASASAGSGASSATGPCTGTVAHGPLAWYEDDYAAALACARATKRPLVVDMWAPWCHTCLSMQTTVMRDASLTPLADRFVFVAIDTDREANAAVVARYPLQNWPTFFVVAPEDESVQERWLGAASIEQFRTLLKDGETAYLATQRGGTLDPLLAGLRAGNQAALKKDWKAAAAAWAEVLAAAPADWPRRSDVLVSSIAALWKGGEVAACLDLALAQGGATGTTANATDFLGWAHGCAGDKGPRRRPERHAHGEQRRRPAAFARRQGQAEPGQAGGERDRGIGEHGQVTELHGTEDHRDGDQDADND